MKRFLLLLPVLLTACSIDLEEQEHSIRSIPLQERAEREGIVCTADGFYPHIENLPSVQVEANINSHFDEFAFGIRENIESCPNQLSDLTEEGAEILDSTDVDFRVARFDKKYVSVVLVQSQYFEGAAHPNNSIDSLTFDLQTGQPVALEDLFTNSDDFEVELNRKVAEAISKAGYGEYPSDHTNPIGKFYLSDKSLVLIDLFSLHALKGFEVEIPFDSLQ